MTDTQSTHPAASEEWVWAMGEEIATEDAGELREALVKILATVEWTPNKPDFVEAMILLASLHVGTNEALIAQTLGVAFDQVSAVGARLRAGGIWIEDRVIHARRWSRCFMCFFLDVNVATGSIICSHDEDGEPKYRKPLGDQ